MKPVLLDLFCGAGGAAMGYHQAGFHVIGADLAAMPRFPFQFVQADALAVLDELVAQVQRGERPTFAGLPVAAVHNSPPCQGYSAMRHRTGGSYPLLIAPVRERVERLGLPYVIEGAASELREPVQLCGSSFGLRVRRHRLFECSFPAKAMPCEHGWQDDHKPYRVYVGRGRNPLGYRVTGVVPVFGGSQVVGGQERLLKAVAMGVDWMSAAELNEAIPPVYTLHLGRQLREHLESLDSAEPGA